MHTEPTGRNVLALSYGIVCHSFFALGVGAMMVAMFFGMSKSLGGVPPPWSWVVNAALLIQFPVGHSVLLTTRGRRLLMRLAPAGTGSTLSTTTFATIAGMQTCALFALWSPSGIVWWQAHGFALLGMALLYGMSWLLLLWSMWSAGLGLQTGSLGWTALYKGRPPRYPGMPQKGLFRVIRQPIYVTFALTLWTVPMWTPDQLVVAVVLTAYCVVAPRFKERRYRRMYGEAFEEYTRRVPYWLPFPRPRAAPPAAGRIRPVR